MANFNLNKVIIGGRLTAEPELRTTNSQVPVVRLTVAVNRRFGNRDTEQPQADFINVVAWRSTAEFISRYFHKGSSICLSGSIQVRNYTDQSGQKRYVTEVVADEAYFVDSKSESGYSAPATPVNNDSVPEEYGMLNDNNAYQNQTAPAFDDVTEDELPF